MGINGAAFATTITTAILMIIILYIVKLKTNVSMPYKNVGLIILCNIILLMVCLIIPKTIPGLIIGCIVGFIIYSLALITLRVLSMQDIKFFIDYMNKIPKMNKFSDKIVKFIEKHNLYSK